MIAVALPAIEPLGGRPSVGVSSYAFGWAVDHAAPPVDEQHLLDFARRHALTVVQLADNLPLHEMPAARVEAFAAAAGEAGIAIELGARGLAESHLRTYLELCTRCRATLLRFVTDGPDYAPSPGHLIALLRNAVPVLRAAGVTLALENHDRLPSRVLRHIVDEVGDALVGICLDTANSLGAGEGLEAVTATLAPVTVNLHVKDVAITRLPYLMGFTIEGRRLGTGVLPIVDTLARVIGNGRCQSVILESWTPPGPDTAETVARERADAETSIDVLKAMLRDAAAVGQGRAPGGP